jgi:predicted RecA/RadA family phage recombinase
MASIVLFSALGLIGLAACMRALSADSPLKVEEGDFNDLPVLTAVTIYEGSAVGLSSGYARALVAGDAFQGHAFEQADNTSGASGAINVRVRSGTYKLQVTLASVAVTDVGKDVYMSDDATYTLTQGSNSAVGKVHRYVTTNTCIVMCQGVSSSADQPNHQHTSATDGGGLTSPHITTSIQDANGLDILMLTATASAVNEITLANAATLNNPSIIPSGETNVGLDITMKGTGDLTMLAGTGDIIMQCGTVAADKISLQAYDIDGTAYVEMVKVESHATTCELTLGAASTDLIGFYGTTPAAQPAHVADPAACASMTQGTYTASTTLTDPPTKAEAEAELALIDAELDKVKVDTAACKTAIDLNNAAIDSILAQLATLGLQAAT